MFGNGAMIEAYRTISVKKFHTFIKWQLDTVDWSVLNASMYVTHLFPFHVNGDGLACTINLSADQWSLQLFCIKFISVNVCWCRVIAIAFLGHVLVAYFILLTFTPLHFVVGRLGSWHASVFGLLPSQLSFGFRLCPLSPGIANSTLVCLHFAFHLLSSVISFSWPHLYPAFAHVQTISTSSLGGIPLLGTCVPFSRCLHFSHELVSSFLLPTATCAFQLCAISSPPSF